MSQDRVLGSKVLIQINTALGPTLFAEIDSFDEKNEEKLDKRHPLGQVQPHGQKAYEGYQLTIRGAVVDPSVENLELQDDVLLLSGQPANRYTITRTVSYYNAPTKVWTYPNALLYGFTWNAAAADDEVKFDCTAFCPVKTDGTFAPSLGGNITGGGSGLLPSPFS